MNSASLTRAQSFARIGVVYVFAIAAGAAWFAWGPATAWRWLDGLIADLIATVVVFVGSRILRNSSVYDAYWSVLPPLLMLGWWIESGTPADDLRCWLVMVVIALWAVRLTVHWARGYPGLQHEDWRYPMVRDRAGRAEAVADLLGIHVFPTLQVFLGMLPVYIVITRTGRGVNWLDVIAVLIGVSATAIEYAADAQMIRFIETRRPGQVMDQGLWAWSRHPNYLGEVSLWLSLAIFGLAAAPSTWWWIFVGVAAMYAMFRLVSIPMMETRSLERRPAYSDVVDRVSCFFLRPPRRTIANV